MDKIKLHPAFSWDCPSCGRENFARTLKFNMTPQQVREHLQFLDKNKLELNDCFDFTIVTSPKLVICCYCKKSYSCKEE